ncbi:glutaredoxin family protein [Neptunomonas japonica]|uniref:glutaredoxin family protein n=1 Tax=Neptunomonas japonica TaxID=417574 RepID=UPI0004075285|nr:glutaredoxin family protein [Neptunomonas japonica]
MQNFVFLTTQGCHLCEVAEALLVASLNPECHQVDVIDIAYDDALLECYGERIPVFKNEDTQAELNWPFDADKLEHFVALTV